MEIQLKRVRKSKKHGANIRKHDTMREMKEKKKRLRNELKEETKQQAG